MVPAEYKDFMLAIVGASASFIGLLFVALSVVIPKLDMSHANRERHLAITAYNAFLNIFFLSLVALMPTYHGVGIVALIFGLTGTLNALSQIKLIITRLHKRGLSTVMFIVPLMAVIYGLECYFGIRALQTRTAEITQISGIIFALFITGLARAWELLGIQEHPSRKVRH